MINPELLDVFLVCKTAVYNTDLILSWKLWLCLRVVSTGAGAGGDSMRIHSAARPHPYLIRTNTRPVACFK